MRAPWISGSAHFNGDALTDIKQLLMTLPTILPAILLTVLHRQSNHPTDLRSVLRAHARRWSVLGRRPLETKTSLARSRGPPVLVSQERPDNRPRIWRRLCTYGTYGGCQLSSDTDPRRQILRRAHQAWRAGRQDLRVCDGQRTGSSVCPTAACGIQASSLVDKPLVACLRAGHSAGRWPIAGRRSCTWGRSVSRPLRHPFRHSLMVATWPDFPPRSKAGW